MKTAVHDIADASKAKFITIGKKATDFFNREAAHIEESHLGISEKPSYADAQKIAKLALRLYAQEKVDEIKLIYTEMESTISQVPKLVRLLPVDVEAAMSEEVESDEFITYEPSPEAVLGYLIPKYVESTIYGGLVESAASEQAARRVAMESATDNAQELIDSLTLTFNQARQAAITQEISEIVGGANALE
jgi:F-type H+-transporting ATPase subunit gamma